MQVIRFNNRNGFSIFSVDSHVSRSEWSWWMKSSAQCCVCAVHEMSCKIIQMDEMKRYIIRYSITQYMQYSTLANAKKGENNNRVKRNVQTITFHKCLIIQSYNNQQQQQQEIQSVGPWVSYTVCTAHRLQSYTTPDTVGHAHAIGWWWFGGRSVTNCVFVSNRISGEWLSRQFGLWVYVRCACWQIHERDLTSHKSADIGSLGHLNAWLRDRIDEHCGLTIAIGFVV